MPNNAHATGTRNVAESIPNARQIYYNRGFLTESTGILQKEVLARLKASVPNFRPDALVRDANGQWHWVEVLSQSQLSGKARDQVIANARQAARALEKEGIRVTTRILTPEQANRAAQYVGSVKNIGRILGPAIALGSVAWAVASAPSGQGLQAAGIATASAGGGWAGASAGAAVGSIFGPVGTVLGGLIGGMMGGQAAEQGARGVELAVPGKSPRVMFSVRGRAPGGPCALASLDKHELAVLFRACATRSGLVSLSLDPADPTRPFEPKYAANVTPSFLAGTALGKVMFEADVLIKSLVMGIEVPPLDGWRAPGDFGCPTMGAYRVWLQPDASAVPVVDIMLAGSMVAGVAVHGCALRVNILGQEQAAGAASGLKDAGAPDAEDCFRHMVEQCNTCLPELIAYYPVLGRLAESHRALVACKALHQLGVSPGRRWCQRFSKPVSPLPANCAAVGSVLVGGPGASSFVTGAVFLAAEDV